MIIDASVAFKWLVPEADSAAAEQLLGADLVAPRLMLSEVGNAIWKRVRKGEMVWSDTLMIDLARLPELVVLEDEAQCMARALEIAHELDHAIYDCVYLALAEVSDDVLITADNRFVNKIARHPSASRVRTLAT